MHEFTPEQAARWDAWQHAYRISARRSDLIARVFGVTLLASTFTAVAVAMWRY
jgi:hypothetical protein